MHKYCILLGEQGLVLENSPPDMLSCPLKFRGAKPLEDQIHLRSDHVFLRAGRGGHLEETL